MRKSNGEGLGAKLLITQIEKKKDAHHANGAVKSFGCRDDDAQTGDGDEPHHKRAGSNTSNAGLSRFKAVAHGIGKRHEHPWARGEDCGNGNEKKDPIQMRVDHTRS